MILKAEAAGRRLRVQPEARRAAALQLTLTLTALRCAAGGAQQTPRGGDPGAAVPTSDCRDQELDACSSAEHNKSDWDGDDDTDYQVGH